MNKTYLCVFIVFIILIFSIKYVNIESFDNNKQLIFKQTLEDMKEILDLNNVPFFLCFGTIDMVAPLSLWLMLPIVPTDLIN